MRRLELGAGLIGETGDRIEINAGQDQPFVTPEGFDVSDLALQIDIVFGIDLKMDGDPLVNGRQLRPNGADLLPADLGISKQLKG